MMHPAKRQESRHLALLSLLLLFFVLSPLVVTLRYGVLILNTIGAAVLLSGTYAVSERKKLFLVTAAIGIATVAVNCLIIVLPGERLILLSNVCLLILLALFSVSILGDVLRGGRVTADKIYGALCVYLLVGYAWT